MNLNLEKISFIKFITYTFLFLALIMPGFGYLYLSNLELFMKLDFMKLIFLSILFSIPLFIIGLIISTIKLDEIKKDKDRFALIFVASVFTLTIFFLAIFFNIPLDNYLKNIDLIWRIYGFGLGILTISYIAELIKEYKK